MACRTGVEILLVAVASLALAGGAAAITLEQAMEKCNARYAPFAVTEGAPKQYLAIEACARQMVQESPQDPEPAAQPKRRRHRQ